MKKSTAILETSLIQEGHVFEYALNLLNFNMNFTFISQKMPGIWIANCILIRALIKVHEL